MGTVKTLRLRFGVAPVLALLGILAVPVPAPACPLDQPGAPRILLLALDGAPLRVIQEAQRRGAFEGWPEVVGMITPYPSMTNVGFTAILAPIGLPSAIEGYEIRRFLIEENRIHGGKSKASVYPWKDQFHVISSTLGSKLNLYTSPVKATDKLLDKIEEIAMASFIPQVILSHIPSTDMTAHLKGEEETIEVVMKVDAMLSRLIPAHREKFGRDLQVILLSDHGNGAEKVWNTNGLRDALRDAGFKFGKKLETPNDIVAPIYGAVNYGPLYLDPSRARDAATAAVGHTSVEVASWVSGNQEITVLSKGQEAVIRWTETDGVPRYAYETVVGDPLGMKDALTALEAEQELDGEGFASRSAWFEASTDEYYPDAVVRLVNAHVRRWVENPATVLLSLGPRYAWGLATTRLGAGLLGGRQEGTHGGLDRDSSLAFILVNDHELQPKSTVPADQALVPWGYLKECLEELADDDADTR